VSEWLTRSIESAWPCEPRAKPQRTPRRRDIHIVFLCALCASRPPAHHRRWSRRSGYRRRSGGCVRPATLRHPRTSACAIAALAGRGSAATSKGAPPGLRRRRELLCSPTRCMLAREGFQVRPVPCQQPLGVHCMRPTRRSIGSKAAPAGLGCLRCTRLSTRRLLGLQVFVSALQRARPRPCKRAVRWQQSDAVGSGSCQQRRVGTALASTSPTAAPRHLVRSQTPVPRLTVDDAPKPCQRSARWQRSDAVEPGGG